MLKIFNANFVSPHIMSNRNTGLSWLFVEWLWGQNDHTGIQELIETKQVNKTKATFRLPF